MVQMDIDPDLKKRSRNYHKRPMISDKLNELDAYHMKELREVVTALGKAITEANDVKSNERYTKVSEMAEAVFKGHSAQERPDGIHRHSRRGGTNC